MRYSLLFSATLLLALEAPLRADEELERVMPHFTSLQTWDHAIQATAPEITRLHASEDAQGYLGIYALGRNIFVCFYGKTPALKIKQQIFEQGELRDSSGKSIHLGAVKNPQNPELLAETILIKKNGDTAVYAHYLGSRIPCENVAEGKVQLILPALNKRFDLSIKKSSIELDAISPKDSSTL